MATKSTLPSSFPNFDKASATLPGQKLVSCAWQPVCTTDSHFVDTAKWAVNEYNKKNGKHLLYEALVCGFELVVAGDKNYWLVIKAKEEDVRNSKSKYYVAWVQNLKATGCNVLMFFAPVCTLITPWKLDCDEWESVYVYDSHVIEIAKWAVDDYNKKFGKSLQFDSVSCALKKIVACGDIKYCLIIKTKDGELYLAGVYEWPSNGAKECVYFGEFPPKL